MPNIPPTLHSIRGWMGLCHLLEDGDRSVFIDAGMVGEPWFIRRLVTRLGLRPQSIAAILITHGHLDHCGNAAWLKEWTGAKIYAHPREAEHLRGGYGYRGVARVCGALEAAGRLLFRYRPVEIDEVFEDGAELPFWGGLRVMHMPGHTEGHCGFYSAKHDLLFCGDMFASYFFNVHRPPAILNSCPEKFAASYEKMRKLNAKWIVPSHYDRLDGALHRKRFDRLMKRFGG
jgi:glyoxylase-like metal-dependent hydrolase (beta-lactamase superfamily II)